MASWQAAGRACNRKCGPSMSISRKGDVTDASRASGTRTRRSFRARECRTGTRAVRRVVDSSSERSSARLTRSTPTGSARRTSRNPRIRAKCRGRGRTCAGEKEVGSVARAWRPPPVAPAAAADADNARNSQRARSPRRAGRAAADAALPVRKKIRRRRCIGVRPRSPCVDAARMRRNHRGVRRGSGRRPLRRRPAPGGTARKGGRAIESGRQQPARRGHARIRRAKRVTPRA